LDVPTHRNNRFAADADAQELGSFIFRVHRRTTVLRTTIDFI
jgi:hypothetical protein